MNRELNLNIDIDNRKVTNYNGLVKQGDLVSLTINVLSVKEEVNLNEQIVKIFLKKEDGTKVEQSVTVNKNIVTCELDLQATTIVGKVTGELLITKDDSQVTSSTFTFEVEGAISQEVLEESKDSIETFNKVISTLNEANTLIEQYKDSMQPIAGTTESVTALNNIKTYIDTNLSVLQNSNTKAEENIEALREFENVVEVAEDVAKLKEDVANNTASLNENTQNIEDLQERFSNFKFYDGRQSVNIEFAQTTPIATIVQTMSENSILIDATTGENNNVYPTVNGLLIIIKQKGAYRNICKWYNQQGIGGHEEYIGYVDNNNWSGWQQLATIESTEITNFQNGWAKYPDTSFGTGLTKVGNLINLSILVSNSAPINGTTIFTLPSGFIPKKSIIFIGNTGDSTFETRIYNDGRVEYRSGGLIKDSYLNLQVTYSL